ncbi:MAG: ribosome small subunit-dependent GTPase A [Coriobacteriia bacterium]|nr:ribosome small subunit-dependent GTPase A [Coriobacteriia bacterium]
MNEFLPETHVSDFLEAYGWSDRWSALFNALEGDDPARYPGRVVRADRGSVLAVTRRGIERAQLSANLRKRLSSSPDLPATGDWLSLSRPSGHESALVDEVLPRASAFTRGDPGEGSAARVLAASVDVAFVVQPLDGDPNLRRIERQLALAWESGATPVVVLTKADLSADPETARSAVERVALGVDVVLTSAVSDGGAETVRAYVRTGTTVALIGPSGAGKSTLVNALLGEQRQATREIRLSDGKGRHTTVTRELILLPGGGVLMDMPGMRAMAVHDLASGLDSAFPDIVEFASACRFRDCTHKEEPGCGVAAAVMAESLSAERLASYHKLQREAVVAAMKTDARLRAEEVRKWKIIHKSVRGHDKRTGFRGA